MTVPKNAIDLAQFFEGFEPLPYLCPARVPSIGFGSTVYPNGKKVTLQDKPVTRAQATSMMVWELEHSMAATLRLCPVLLSVREEWLGAIVDFTYNLGSGRLQQSTLRRKINARDWKAVPAELNKWVFGGGVKLPGLVLRRKAEAAFFT